MVSATEKHNSSPRSESRDNKGRGELKECRSYIGEGGNCYVFVHNRGVQTPNSWKEEKNKKKPKH